MRIVVPVKHVPDIHSDRTFTDEGRVARGADDGTLNELDENAIEAALQLVEGLDEAERAVSEVVAVTVGPPEADAALRKAFQLGVDRAVRLTDDALAGSDVFGTAKAIAAVVRTIAADGQVDLVITGMAALDGLASVIPALVSSELGLPQLTLATRLSVEHGQVEIVRDLDGVTEVLSAPAPAASTPRGTPPSSSSWLPAPRRSRSGTSATWAWNPPRSVPPVRAPRCCPAPRARRAPTCSW